MTILETEPEISDSTERPNALLKVLGAQHPGFCEILTPDALDFVAQLQRRFGAGRRELLTRRSTLARPAAARFGPDTAAVRADRSWQVAPLAPGLEDRRCEITGPPTRKMTIGALNSGARVWMADFEDATSPTWFNIINGQRNLYDAIRRQIDYSDETGRRHELGRQTATIMVRPRGWHLAENHLWLHGKPVAGAFVDFGLYFFHNAKVLIENGHGPYFYLPKLESHREARLWHDVFAWSESQLGLVPGTIRASCLIETFPAAFQMTEILYELRDYSAGLNAGRWDYLFSVIKNHATDQARLLPDRDQLNMKLPFMRAYTGAAGPDLPRAWRSCDRRDGRFCAQQCRSGRYRTRAHEDPSRQDAGGRGRVRRLLGRSSRAGAGLHGGVRSPIGGAPEPDRPSARRRRRWCSQFGRHRPGSPER